MASILFSSCTDAAITYSDTATLFSGERDDIDPFEEMEEDEEQLEEIDDC